ncbi:MAG: hypothetical protein CL870_04585 [Cytophagia bacterium]|jgi:hypothetical protein|nr:hypothetical protein [Cytophagia bacterium]|tara:strand:- start:1739 stop:2452 length:714 start_codon:yes stop_codon:yes gene_type:complete
MNTRTIRISLLILLFFPLILNGKNNILSAGDSLFKKEKYYDAKKYYDSLFYNKKMFSYSMLIKMSFIEESLGNFEKSIYYLSFYKKRKANVDVDNSLKKIIVNNNLKSFEGSDYKFFEDKFLVNKYYVIYLLLSISVLIFIYNIYNIYKRKKINYIKSFFTINIFLLIVLNFKNNSSGIISNNNTFIMYNPSSGSDVHSIINKGEKIEITGETDFWYEIMINKERRYIRKKNLLKIN